MMIKLLAARSIIGSRGILLVIIGWALTATLGVTIVEATARSSPAPGHAAIGSPVVDSLGAPDYSHPFVDETKTTLADARSKVGFPVPMPSSVLANQSDLTEAWVSSERQAALVFDDGKITVMMQHAIFRDPASFFKQYRKGVNAKTLIVRVDDRATLVVMPHTDPVAPNPALVEFDRHGIDVTIVSATCGTKTLLAVAESMK